MFKLISNKVLFAFVLLTIASYYLCNGQILSKPGDCPPPIQYDVCFNKCYNDVDCRGNMKCCSTSCGGSVCLRAVTMRNQKTLQEKAGNCPETPSGPWVCTSRCAYDGDCRGRLKCCKNRCDAMACTKPEV